MRDRKPTRTRDHGRGERVLPGIWRLRLPLDLPNVPHCNAWALQASGGIVLVDTGMHDRDSMGNLERALEEAGFKIRDVRQIVITHAHIDHCGQAPPIASRAGCEVWMHPAWKLHAQHPPDLDETIEVALQSGVPEEPLRRWAEHHRDQGSGQAGELHADHDLVPGVTIETDAGVWQVVETPGHAPSHVCLHQPEQRLLISGDHLLGRVSQYFDVGYTPDPVGEFLRSLDVTDALDARLALAGHARAFTDVAGHIQANRDLVARNLDTVRATLRQGDKTAYEIARVAYGDQFTQELAGWQMTMTTAWLTHLEVLGEAAKTPPEGEDPVERWTLVS